MAASRPEYLMDWRSTMTLIPRDYNTQVCGDPGKTFRGPHARVENSLNRVDNWFIDARTNRISICKTRTNN